MQRELPPPLVPAGCDLRDFAFMPLDVVRLRDSDLAALGTAEGFRAAVLLWCASWHQVPASSLPDDDKVLANLAGYGRVVKEWMKERDGALRGWVKCADNRLYHPVVAEKANEAWLAKLKQRWMTECKRIRKHMERHHIDVPVPEFEAWLEDGCRTGQPLPVADDNANLSQRHPQSVAYETGSKGQGYRQGQGQGQGEELIPTIGGTSPPPSDGGVAPVLDLQDPEPPAIPACDHQAVLALWRQHMPTNPQPAKWTETRRRHLQARWRELFAERKAATRDEALAWFAKFFRYLAKSAFLTGRAAPQPGRPTFFAELDWVLGPENFAKCIEGKYHPET